MGSSIDLNAIGTKLEDHDARVHRDTVADLLSRPRTTFPGAQPVSFARRHLLELERQDYYMCEKTDGIRCLLYLHHFIVQGQEPIEAQFLIDRKNDYYHIPAQALHLPLENELGGSHTGTLLDGELVVEHYQDGRGDVLIYMIFDCLCLDGADLTKRQYDIRLGKVQKFVYQPWVSFAEKYQDDAAAQPFQLRLKKMEMSYGSEMMFKDIIPRLRHGNDGLIFTCKSTPYVTGTDPHILKWKPPHENTIDFRLQLGAFPTAEDADGQYEDWDAVPEMELLVNMGGSEELFAELHVTEQEWEGFKSLNQQIDHRIIECWRDASTGHWRPKIEHHDGTPRFRDDKREANHISTVKSVLESIEDAVGETDLVAQAGKIKEAWKQRANAARKRHAQEQRRHKEAEQQRQRRAAEQQRAQQAAQDDAPGYS